MTASARILVVGPAWVGDMVMAQSLFISLKHRDPEAVIDVVAPAWSLPLLARMPEVRRAVALPIGHGEFGLAARWRIGRVLRSEGYTKAIVLPRSLKAALLPFFASIPLRSGYRGEMRYGLINDMRPLDKAHLPQVTQRYVYLGSPADAALPPATPYPHLRIDQERVAQVVKELDLNLDRPVVAFMPGAEYGPAKRWPLEHYGELAAQLQQQGYQVWVFGSAKEIADGDAIAAHAPGVVNLCGRTQLVDVVDLLSCAAVAVSNDSGLMHVAAAVGIPLVAIYGSSTPAYTPPLTESVAILYRGLECSPCFKRNCPLDHTDCLRGISSTMAHDALTRLLANNQQHEVE